LCSSRRQDQRAFNRKGRKDNRKERKERKELKPRRPFAFFAVSLRPLRLKAFGCEHAESYRPDSAAATAVRASGADDGVTEV